MTDETRSNDPDASESRAKSPPEGLCPSCRHVQTVVSERGSRFLLCRLSAQDERYRKYPPQPVMACSGWVR